jgi:hypothetical protein
MPYFIPEMIGALIPTFLLSRLALWLLKRWLGGKTRLLFANLASWLFVAVLGGFAFASFATFTFEAAVLYALPQLIWLAMDMMLLRRASASEQVVVS